jgi:hypothetical protein
MFTDFNMVVSKRTVKIPTLGGAIAGFVTVDCHSDYVHGNLVPSVADSVEQIKHVHQQYKRDGHTIRTSFRVNTESYYPPLNGTY